MPPNDLQLGLKADADRVASTARSIRSWVKEAQKSSPTVSTEADSLTAESRRLESTARKLSTAATRRMCVGIFGASQQGKSYLVSVLAQVPGAGKLLTRFGA